MEGIEKVICCDKGNDALAYAADANPLLSISPFPVLSHSIFSSGKFCEILNNAETPKSSLTTDKCWLTALL